VQPDGEAVVAGDSGGRVLVERFSTSGALDGSYAGASGYARAVAIEPGGQIVIAGSSAGAMFAQRLTSSLQPDGSFGSGGIASAFSGEGGVAYGVALAPDGSVVLAGSVGASQAAVASFSSSGQSQFAVSLPLVPGSSLARAVTVESNGDIIVAGSRFPGLEDTYGYLARLTPSGSLDGSFASGGVAYYAVPNSGYTSLNAVSLSAGGEIVAGGAAAGGPDNLPQAFVVRYTGAGALDGSFGSGGLASADAGENLVAPEDPTGAYAMTLAGGGALVDAGDFENTGTQVDAGLWAFTSAGAQDSAFGTAGRVLDPTGAWEACAIALAPDGSLLVAGDAVTAFPDSDPCAYNPASTGWIARYIGLGPPPAPASAPTVSTGAASAITPVSATLSGAVNPDGLAGSYHFEYGSGSSYGSSTPAQSLAAGSASVPVSAALSGLAPGITYHYRLVASNADGTADGGDRTFTTPAGGAPAVFTGATSRIGEVSATLGGTVSPDGLPTGYRFQYGASSVALRSSSGSATLGAGAGASGVSRRITGLEPGRRYYYRLAASNAAGTRYGAVRSFRTVRRLALKWVHPPRSYRLAGVLAHGLALRVRCDQPCSLAGSIRISAATARRLGLGPRPRTLGARSVRLARAGVARVLIALSPAAARVLRRGRTSLRGTLLLRASPLDGGPAVHTARTVTLRG
jgi:uncharacterized delta-60 repeat protein